MKLLILSFYYPPDLSAGSFRTKALVHHLQDVLQDNDEIHVITTLPNRFISYDAEAISSERQGNLTIHRLTMPESKSGLVHQVKIFAHFAYGVNQLVGKQDYDLIYATSSKLFTATLGSWFARRQKCQLYLDIRDIFVDTAKDVLPRILSKTVTPVFSLLEKWTINRANQVNLVSPGFKEYFSSRYPKKEFQFFTNGVDPELLNNDYGSNLPLSGQPINIVYAGTFGEGQGLDLIVPDLAKKMGAAVHFKIIGDGARKKLLIEKIKVLGCSNVEIIPPMNRESLLKQYQSADVLFLHLNTHDAFHKVLPSKLFEYGAIGKPIWAGVSGYAAEFIKNELSNAVVFTPSNLNEAISVFSSLLIQSTSRDKFVKKYLRTTIMNSMAKNIYELVL